MGKTCKNPTEEKTCTISVNQSKTFPFMILEETTTTENESKTKFKIALANSIVSNHEFDTKKEAENYISTPNWELIMNFVGITIELAQKNETK